MNTMRSYELEIFDPIIEEEVEDTLPQLPEITEEDVERARRAGIQLGVEQGFSAGEKQAKEELEKIFAQAAAENDQEVEKLFGQLAEQFEIVFAQYQQDIDNQTRLMLEMSKAVWRQMMPQYVARYGDAEIVAIVEECLQSLKSESRVVIEYAADNAEQMKKMLEPLAKIYENSRKLELVESATLSQSDVRLRWESGFADRSIEEMLQAVEGIVDQAMNDYQQQQERNAAQDADQVSVE